MEHGHHTSVSIPDVRYLRVTLHNPGLGLGKSHSDIKSRFRLLLTSCVVFSYVVVLQLNYVRRLSKFYGFRK